MIEGCFCVFQEIGKIFFCKGIDGEVEGCGQLNMVIIQVVGGGKYFFEYCVDLFGVMVFEDKWQNEGEFVIVMLGYDCFVWYVGVQLVCYLVKDFVVGIVVKEVVDWVKIIEIGDVECEGGWIVGVFCCELGYFFLQVIVVFEFC